MWKIGKYDVRNMTFEDIDGERGNVYRLLGRTKWRKLMVLRLKYLDKRWCFVKEMREALKDEMTEQIEKLQLQETWTITDKETLIKTIDERVLYDREWNELQRDTEFFKATWGLPHLEAWSDSDEDSRSEGREEIHN